MAMNSLQTNTEFINSISNYLFEDFKAKFPNRDPQMTEMLKKYAQTLAADNSDLVVNYVQKRAAERAVSIINSRLRDGLTLLSI